MAVILSLPLLTGAAPYPAYNYSWLNREVYPMLPAAVPDGLLIGADLGVGAFRNPRDFRFGPDGLIYMADTGNHRILVLDDALNLLRVVDGFSHNGAWETFSQPEGVFAEADGTLYVADTQNERVVVLNADGSLRLLMDGVVLTGSGLTFRPQKIGVDNAGRIYTVSSGSTEGLIQLTAEGSFVRFFGSNRVRPNPIEVMYRFFLTRRQRQAREQFVPTEYSNLHIDEMGFIYATTRNVRSGQVRRLNALGNDVLRHDGLGLDVYGDLAVTPRNYNRVAQFVSVTADGDGNIYALDNATGKAFVYDASGALLFMFGGRGDQVGLFADPQAIAEKNGTIYVLDAGRSNVTIYRLSDFGEKILLANHLYRLGEFDKSLEPWSEVARMSSTYTEAYYYLGWTYFGRKEYAEAMAYFRLGHGPNGYSRAFGELRDQWLRDHFAWLALGLAAGLAGLAVFTKIKRKKTRGG
ncbi:MAG: hypothetical protein FWG72_10155 [Oscillospiraceae bacterium]|nr:hypothetical protein [Oscillospiraceae bacterium]